ncbi:MAG: aminopeptidase P family protein [Methanobacteriota archaeon]
MEKIKTIKGELDKRGLDVFLSLQNTRYLADTDSGKAVIVPRDGEPILICSRLELERAKRESWIKDIRAFSSWKAPLQRGERVFFLELWQLVTEVLDILDARSIGYDKAEKNFIRKVRNAHAASYRAVPEITQDLRKIKSAKELVLLRKSAEMAVLGMNRAAELIQVGMTELEIAAEVEYKMRRAESEGTPFQIIVASGGNSWLPHSSASRKKLRRGELIVVDLGATFKGYASDMTRTFGLSPTPKQSRVLQIVRRAQEAALAKVKDGVQAKAVDAAARNFIARAGYSKFFNHGSGHGVGLEIHEAPSLAPSSEDILRKDMVITVEPGIYVPKVGGARWEDTVLVKSNGYEPLTHYE